MRRRDDDDVAFDGEIVHARLYLKDGNAFDARNHQPHFYAPVNDATRRRKLARDSYVERTVNAWRRPVASEPDVGAAAAYRDPNELDPNERLLRGHLREPNENEENQGKRDASWRDYKTRLSESWRSPGVTNPNRAHEVERLRRRTTHEAT